jgi:purine nucleosidase
MNRMLISILLAWLLYSIAASPGLACAAAPSPILLDTDIGTEIDDPFALLLALGSPELDVRGITTVGTDTQQKAMLLCRFLTVTGRRNIAISAGAKPQPDRPITSQHKYYYHPDGLFNRTTKPADKPAAEFLYERIKQQPKEITIVALGPLTNLARLLEEHPDSVELIRQVILLESNLSLDLPAARMVLSKKVPLLILSADACSELHLDDAGVERVFSPGSSLTRQVESLYQMWDQHQPPLGDALAVALCQKEQFVQVEKRMVRIDDQGAIQADEQGTEARIVTTVDAAKFTQWYADRIAILVPPSRRPSKLIAAGGMPHRVHVAEDFETDIERSWWMSGKPETTLLPPASHRACRAVLTHDFDDLLMVSRQMYSAVIFNPVPGPPMGKNTRLSFQYWLKGTDTIRVQIYSLTNGYHRQMYVSGLPEGRWQEATVDLTEARRPDGTGGPLSENERIDDIQFYIDPDAELVIDKIVLFDAATPEEKETFPQRIVFTGVFDTGKQGEQWPGDFEIIPDAGNFWKAAQTVPQKESGEPWIRVGLRGQRSLSDKTDVSFRYRLEGTDTLQLQLVDSESAKSQSVDMKDLKTGEWAQATISVDTRQQASANELRWLLPKGAKLLIDDVLLYEPGSK